MYALIKITINVNKPLFSVIYLLMSFDLMARLPILDIFLLYYLMPSILHLALISVKRNNLKQLIDCKVKNCQKKLPVNLPYSKNLNFNNE